MNKYLKKIAEMPDYWAQADKKVNRGRATILGGTGTVLGAGLGGAIHNPINPLKGVKGIAIGAAVGGAAGLGAAYASRNSEGANTVKHILAMRKLQAYQKVHPEQGKKK